MSETFLRDACQATALLGQLHHAGAIHGALLPRAFIRDADGSITGIRPADPVAEPLVLLRYSSPEQAGRLRDVLSPRSDLYSLGCILHEWAAGFPPFTADDPLELVHCQMAIPPPPLSSQVIPPILAGIILKLLAKNPEHRYASAAGLLHDLNEARRRLQDPAAFPAAFPLGAYDIATQFVLKDKLYGREGEIERLLKLYRQAAEGEGSLCLIAGYSGIGKTALALTLLDLIRAAGGRPASGKFDQFRRQVPYSAFLDMFQSLIRQVLGGIEADITAWKKAYLAATGDNAKVAADLLPDLARLIGTQPDPVPLSGDAAEHRFKEVFAQLFRLFTGPRQPLVVFLDDLQWADFASLSLIQHLLSAGDVAHTLFIGAYRDNEVDAAHPLHAMTAELRKKNVPVAELVVNPLRREDLEFMLEDACSGGLRHSQEFIGIVMAKTEGNPFFTRQFLNEIHRSGVLFYDPNTCLWDWKSASLRAVTRAENVIDLLSRYMTKLPPDSQQILRFAACAGQEFDLPLLATVLNISPQDALAALAPTLHDELVQPVRDASSMTFRFVHDRVQQTAHALPGKPPTAAIHLTFARILLVKASPDTVDERIFIIADHLVHGRELVTAESDRWTYARLTLRAGLKAKAALAYHSAFNYFDAGIAFLPHDAWTQDFRLAFDLHLQAAEVADLTNVESRVLSLCTELDTRARTPMERLEVFFRRILFANHKGDLAAVMTLGREALACFGIPLPPLDDGPALLAAFNAELAEFRRLTAGRSLADLEYLPDCTNPEHMAVMEILSAMSDASIFANFPLFSLISSIGATRSVRMGNGGLSPMMYSLMSIALIAHHQAYSEIKPLCSAYLSLIQRPGFTPYHFGRCMAYHIWNINHWVEPLETSLPMNEASAVASLKAHNIMYATYQIDSRLWIQILLGRSMDEIIESGDQLVKACEFNNLPFVTSLGAPTAAAAHALRGDTLAIDDLNGHGFDEPSFLSQWGQFSIVEMGWRIAKITVCGLAGDHARVLQLCDGIAQTYPVTYPLNLEWRFWHGVAAATLLRDAATAPDSAAYSALLEDEINYFDFIHQNGHAPNVEARLRLLQAERARCDRNPAVALALYRAAAQSAAANRFTLLAGYCHERLADFQLEIRHFEDSRSSLETALEGYRDCQAKGLLPRIHGKLAALGKPATIPESSGIHPLDAIAVVRAVQVLSGEVDSRRLLRKLLTILVEFAGAERGCIATITSDCVALEESAGAPIVDLPEHLFRYACHTAATICPQNPLAESAFTIDPYVAAHRPLSLYCRTVGKAAPISRVIYLEHRALPGVFVSRLSIIDMIAAQASTSIDVAVAHEQLARYTERTRLEAQLRESQKMEALGTLAGGVAHDFNNALAMIIGNVELARQDVGLNHPALVSLEEIAKACRRSKDLVQQILSFGRRQKLERKATSLALVVVETARLLRATLPATVCLNVHCEPDAPAVLADAAQIKQILLNLCANAAQATQDVGRPGTIKIGLRAHVQAEGTPRGNLRPGRYLCLTVSDTGMGMDEVTRSHIFEPFFTTKPMGKGTGLGLAVVHGIVQAHEARIEVESELGAGSTFRIYFPSVDAPVEEFEQHEAGIARIDGAGRRVLYVDDEEAIIFLMKRLLERKGFRVSGYTNPREALEAVRSNPHEFDLAVTDFNMPGMDGLAVASALREIRADLPVVLASGYITEDLRQRAPAAGVRELIYKPNTVDDLCEAVARYANACVIQTNGNTHFGRT